MITPALVYQYSLNNKKCWKKYEHIIAKDKGYKTLYISMINFYTTLGILEYDNSFEQKYLIV
jgi:hypothetical protein